MRLDILGAGVWPYVLERLHHLGTKPGIMSFAVTDQFQRQGAFVGRARQQDPHCIGNRQPHPFKHGCGAVPDTGVNTCLHECVRRHGCLLPLAINVMQLNDDFQSA